MAAVQRVGLEPFLSRSLSRGSGVGDQRIFPLHEVPNNHLAREGRRNGVSCSIDSVFELRAHNDHANACACSVGNGAGVKPRVRVDGSVQRVG